jgi:hypothetical protein
VQEGGFILVGGALGLDPSTCLALAAARRIRDLLVFVPGLIAWQFAESSNRTLVHGQRGARAVAQSRSAVRETSRR